MSDTVGRIVLGPPVPQSVSQAKRMAAQGAIVGVELTKEIANQRDVLLAALAHFCCPECVDDHMEMPASVSCYCGCHSTARDKSRWAEMRERVLRLFHA
jgi:hypothetical protein